MHINKNKFREDIFVKLFKGNYSKCARSINITPQRLHRFLNQEDSEAGIKLLGGFISFCEKEALNYRDYVVN